MIEHLNETLFPENMQLQTLTLEKNATLVALVPYDNFYDGEMLHSLYEALQKRFPSHSVFVWYDNIKFTAIEDKAYGPERITCNDSSNYY
jgi:hypothetical protein